MTKVWSRVRMMTGKYIQFVSPCLKYNNNIITGKTDFANILADYYKNISVKALKQVVRDPLLYMISLEYTKK